MSVIDFYIKRLIYDEITQLFNGNACNIETVTYKNNDIYICSMILHPTKSQAHISY